MNKKKIFVNLKDYNNELEKILENKNFAENVKNLLLSMLYKIETSYPDYQKTKVIVEEKWKYIEEIINDIQNYCKQIKIIKPTKSEELIKKEPIINKEKGEIKVYQNEEQILKAILLISQKEIEIDEKYYISSEILKEFLMNSNIINKIEVIRDFDGWTWYRDINQIEDNYYNLIYQNILILLGNTELQNAIFKENTDIILNIDNLIKENYGKDIAKKIIYLLILIVTQVKYENNSEQLKQEIEKIKKEKEQFVDKEEIIENLSTEKKQKFKKIDKIEQLLLNRKLLEKEFIKRNKNGEAIFSINALIQIIIEEKEILIKQVKEISEKMNPKNIAKLENSVNKKVKFLEDVQQTQIEQNLIKLQKKFIECLNIKINKSETKKEIIDLIYIIRYYNFLEFNKNQTINNVKELKIDLENLIKKLVIKAIQLKAINNISKDINFNLKIYSQIFKLKIIDLENIELIVVNENNENILKIYDDESLEFETKLNGPTVEGIKKNKKIKMFN